MKRYIRASKDLTSDDYRELFSDTTKLRQFLDNHEADEEIELADTDVESIMYVNKWEDDPDDPNLNYVDICLYYDDYVDHMEIHIDGTVDKYMNYR